MADPGGNLGHDIGSSPLHMHTDASPQLLSYSGPNTDGGSVDLAVAGTFMNTGSNVTITPNPITFELMVWVWAPLSAARTFMSLHDSPEISVQRNGTNWGFVYNNTRVSNSTNYTQQAWHHLVAVYGSGTATLYVDGVAGTGSAIAAVGSVTDLVELNTNHSNTNFAGAFYSEVAIYSTALSSSRVTAHFNALDNATQAPIFSGASGLLGTVAGGTSTNAVYLGILQQILQSVRQVY